ncbi:C2 family cysteine protease [Actinomadura sp. CNU-125]|uniref:C2 family cysteine protease n=1 Tax=Actinomadura sp. CNU-125 TaxID=1904961 RepID=UPI001300CB06|nr:C2 family cysteine protease [Actinomadura sp. CNU-125]
MFGGGDSEPPPPVHASVDQPDFVDPDKIRPPDQYGTPLTRPDGSRIPLFDGDPTREQTQQGAIGDCWLISTLGAIAGHMPEAIVNSVRETEDGNYEVRLNAVERSKKSASWVLTGGEIVVTVTPDLPVYSDNPEAAAFADVSRTGVAWTAILEKAFAGLDQTWTQERKDRWLEFRGINDQAAPPEGYVRLNGGKVMDKTEILTQLTGLPARSDSIATERDPLTGKPADRQVIEEFRRLLDENKPILVGSKFPLKDEPGLTHHVEAGHAYEVVRVDERGQIHIRNPHNANHPLPMSIKEYRRNFSTNYVTLE